MAIYNLGSINLDHLYQVDHFVRPGETLTSTQFQTLLGGKGANQSIALAQAGATVMHIGAIGLGDEWVLADMQARGVNTDRVARVEGASGHAIIQLDKQAENAILLYPGANHCLTPSQIQSALQDAGPGDWLLMQHETNGLEEAIARARQQGLSIAFNPAPMVAERVRPLLPDIDLLIVNEIEAMDLMGTESEQAAEQALKTNYPNLRILLTLGRQGVVYIGPEGRESRPAYLVEAVDTTAAGDTFIGYCLAALARGASIAQAMQQGSAAAAICVTRLGAAAAIPAYDEVQAFIETRGN